MRGFHIDNHVSKAEDLYKRSSNVKLCALVQVSVSVDLSLIPSRRAHHQDQPKLSEVATHRSGFERVHHWSKTLKEGWWIDEVTFTNLMATSPQQIPSTLPLSPRPP